MHHPLLARIRIRKYITLNQITQSKPTAPMVYDRPEVIDNQSCSQNLAKLVGMLLIVICAIAIV
jgi:hypothetical protein